MKPVTPEWLWEQGTHTSNCQGRQQGTTWGHRAGAQDKELWRETGLRLSARIQLST